MWRVVLPSGYAGWRTPSSRRGATGVRWDQRHGSWAVPDVDRHGLTDQPSTLSGEEGIMAHCLRRAVLVAGVVGFILCVSLSRASARIERVERAHVWAELMENNGETARLCAAKMPSDARATLFLQPADG